ncbi:MAG: imelysin family protein [Pseudomonadota bacterium]
MTASRPQRPLKLTAAIAGAGIFALSAAAAHSKDMSAVMDNYSDIALAKFTDSLVTAKALKTAVDALVANPSETTLEKAREAWFAARIPYQQTEVYRFGNPRVDDWEGKVNAWPLDEGLIDYVAADYGTESDGNALYTANIIANASLKIGGADVDASKINAGLLQQLHEAGGVEANVATGYHAIEFLLWGQDLNGTGPGAGNRPASDFSLSACTNGNCERRGAYLTAATNLLIDDLEEMVGAWGKKGAARSDAGKGGAAVILTGMGSLSYGEMAGERMKLGLLLHDPEEEHDCFADNTHNSHYYDVVGIRNAYLGIYVRPDGTKVEGASLSQLVNAKDPALDKEMRAKLDASLAAFTTLKARGDTTEAYDQMIAEGNIAGNAVVQAAIDSLVDQTRSIERVAALVGADLQVEGSDSLDNPEKVFE